MGTPRFNGQKIQTIRIFLRTNKRILLLAAIFLLLLGVALIPAVKEFAEKEQVLGTLALALAEILAAILVVTILVQYIQHYFRRAHEFVLGSIVNEADLASSDTVPTSWSNLLRERLVREVEHVQRTLQSYIRIRPIGTPQNDDVETLRSQVETAYPLEGELEKCMAALARNLPTPSRSSPLAHHGPPQEVLDQLSKLNVQFGLREQKDAAALLAGSVPEQVAPIMTVLGALFPAPVIKVNGYLQCCGHPPARVGLTCEFVDQSTAKGYKPPETLWMETGQTDLSSLLLPPQLPQADSSTPTPPSTIASLCQRPFSGVTLSSPSTSRRTTLSFGEDNPLTSAETAAEPASQQPLSLTKLYTLLLGPAVRWLALEFLEQWLTDHAPAERKVEPPPPMSESDSPTAGKVEPPPGMPSMQESIYYLFGDLYSTSADDYPACRDFFWRKAAEHFQKAIEMGSGWWVPYRALTHMSDKKLGQMGFLAAEQAGMENWLEVTPDKLEQARQRLSDLFETAQFLDNVALTVVTKPTKIRANGEESEIQARIRISKATTLLHYGSKEQVQEAWGLIRKEREANPYDFEEKEEGEEGREDSAVVLHNLACWYAVLVDEMDTGWVRDVPWADRLQSRFFQSRFRAMVVREARIHLVASLLRDTEREKHTAIEDPDLRSIRTPGDVKTIKHVVDSKLNQDQQQALAKCKERSKMRRAAREIVRQVEWQTDRSIPNTQPAPKGSADHRSRQANQGVQHTVWFTGVWREDTVR